MERRAAGLFGDRLAVGGEQLEAERRAVAGDLGVDDQPAVHVGGDLRVDQAGGGLRDERDAAEDAAEPPHVLVFEVAAVAPLVDAHGEDVLAGLGEGRHVELGRHAAALAVADFLSVHPDVEGGIDALEAERERAAVEVGRQVERAAVAAGGVLARHARGVDGERVDDVRVVRPAVAAVAVELPHRRDGQAVPAGVVVVGVPEAVGRVRGRQHPVEPPQAIERQDAGRVGIAGRVERREGGGLIGERLEVRPGGQAVAVERREVLQVGGGHGGPRWERQLSGGGRRGRERTRREMTPPARRTPPA